MNAANSRHAALTLHALPPADREWVLRRLDPQQQLVVEGHLEELRGLCIPAEADLVRSALQQSPPAESESAWRAALAARSGAEMNEVLRVEPVALVARLLDLGPWTWEADFLQCLTPAARARIAALRQRADAAAHELDAWLLREWAARLEPLARADTPCAQPSRRRALAAWWQRIAGDR